MMPIEPRPLTAEERAEIEGGRTMMNTADRAKAYTSRCVWPDCYRLAVHDPTGGNCCKHEHPESPACTDQPTCGYLYSSLKSSCQRYPEWRVFLPAGYPPEMSTDACATHLGWLLGVPDGYSFPGQFHVFPIFATDVNQGWWIAASAEIDREALEAKP